MDKKEKRYKIELDTAERREASLSVALDGTVINRGVEISIIPKKVYKVDAEFSDGREFELDIAEDGMIVKKKF